MWNALGFHLETHLEQQGIYITSLSLPVKFHDWEFQDLC